MARVWPRPEIGLSGVRVDRWFVGLCWIQSESTLLCVDSIFPTVHKEELTRWGWETTRFCQSRSADWSIESFDLEWTHLSGVHGNCQCRESAFLSLSLFFFFFLRWARMRTKARFKRIVRLKYTAAAQLGIREASAINCCMSLGRHTYSLFLPLE